METVGRGGMSTDHCGKITVAAQCVRPSTRSKEQLVAALQMSLALVYLREPSVMFLDLKPPNIGFDGQ